MDWNNTIRNRASRLGPGARPRRRKAKRPLWKALPVLVAVAFVLALLIKAFRVQAFSIPSGSVESALQVGDRVLVDKLTPGLGAKPSRGEVVVLGDPSDWLAGEPGDQPSSNGFVRGVQEALSWIGLMPSSGEKDLIKRVIAVGGDTISCQGTGPVYLNGKLLTEPYLYPVGASCGGHDIHALKVPTDAIYVMGDHRQDWRDSRFHAHDPGGSSVPDSKAIGRAIAAGWPLSRWKALPVLHTFSQPGINTQAASAGHPAATAVISVPITWIHRRRKRRAGMPSSPRPDRPIRAATPGPDGGTSRRPATPNGFRVRLIIAAVPLARCRGAHRHQAPSPGHSRARRRVRRGRRRT